MAADFPDPGRLLFAYGTLMLTTGIAPVDAAMQDAGVSLGRGYIHGHLFDLGEYPGATPWPPVPAGSARSSGSTGSLGSPDREAPRIWGQLLHLKNPAALFAVIDPYEGFDAADPSASEFVRAEATVFLPHAGKDVTSQVYWYNFATEGKLPIASGDYLAWWRAKGEPSQGRLLG